VSNSTTGGLKPQTAPGIHQVRHEPVEFDVSATRRVATKITCSSDQFPWMLLVLLVTFGSLVACGDD
jgi:hypothetical protein